jgi:hypothetical protein
MYILGKTGTGKSTLLQTLIEQDMRHGEGLALLDPHGDLIQNVLAAIPEHRRGDLVYFNVPDPSRYYSFNPLDSVPPLKRQVVASGLMYAFKKIWSDAWGVRLEHILHHSLLTLLDQPQATLADILRLLDDKAFRKAAMPHIRNPRVRDFWINEWEHYPVRYKADAAAPIRNKVGAFLADPLLNRILTQPKSSVDFRRLMDAGKIVLINLSKGKLGEDSSALLGALLVSQIGTAGLSRADVPETERRDFYVYLDEFQTFTTLSLATMFSELRKYRVNLVLANQYLSQIDREVFDAITGNVGTIITFRVGPLDAEFLVKEFAPDLRPLDLMNLPNYHIYLRLMIDGTVSWPFSAVTIMPSADE